MQVGLRGPSSNKLLASPRSHPDLFIARNSNDGVQLALYGRGTGSDQYLFVVLDPDAGEALRRFMDTGHFVPIGDDDRRALDRLAQGVQRVRTEVE